MRNIGCFLKIVGQLESYCFIKSVALRLDVEFVKTTIEMSKMRHALGILISDGPNAFLFGH